MTQRAIRLPHVRRYHLRMGFKDLRVYQAAELLRKEVDKIIAKVGKGIENEVKHVDEAADSVLNNIAEGSAFTYPKKRIYFWQMAKVNPKSPYYSRRITDAVLQSPYYRRRSSLLRRFRLSTLLPKTAARRPHLSAA